MAKKFDRLRKKMSSESLARSHAKARQYADEMALDELRHALDLTQEALAKVLKVKQSAISKTERRTDMYVTTLKQIIHAMGGELQIEAVFPDRRVRIKDDFQATRKLKKRAR